MNNTFNGQILIEKLTKLNNSQQSIEHLSQWCIIHRKRAKQIVETWDELFNGSQKEKRVTFLYLANDIIQNSRRKGNEFVSEFWKVLPKVLKDVIENNDDHAKSVVFRLVEIWGERKVFGSRSQNLKQEILGNDLPPPLENNGKNSNPSKVGRKDTHLKRFKLAVGGMPEKIVSAFQAVNDEHFEEDTALNKCKAAVHDVEKVEKGIRDAHGRGSVKLESKAVNELETQETVLKQCIKKLESVDSIRSTLVTQLKEALKDQESKLELIHAQLQIARAKIEQSSNTRKIVTSSSISGPVQMLNPTEPIPSILSSNPLLFSQPQTLAAFASSKSIDPSPLVPNSNPSIFPHPQPVTTFGDSNPSTETIPSISNALLFPQSQPVTTFSNSKVTTEDENKKAAAAVAAKLAASTSSAQMLTSILSSLVAEEASANNINKSTGLALFPPEKRPKLEKPMSIPDTTTPYLSSVQTHINSLSHSTQQPPFPPPPPPPPPPVQQYMQTSNLMLTAPPFVYGGSGSALPPPPTPLSVHAAIGLQRPNAPQSTQPQQQHQQHQQQGIGYYQTAMTGFYGQNQQQTTPLVPRK